ncbi:TPA: hypothetical protein QDB01_002922 [Burkholderia vietnamiensis]|nr:hypothetical protein [Burkholderia vietnamiensis]
MPNEGNRLGCSKPDCQVASSGQCAEGHTPREACPYIGANNSEDLDLYEQEVELADTVRSDNGEASISLSTGEALDTEGVDEFLRWRPATFIAIVGDNDSGKSTLVCALYDRLLRGVFAGFGFAGSRTLVALERRSHHSRVDSGRTVPETLRTSISDGLQYFHFGIARQERSASRIDLLLSDRAGEVYNKARGNSDMVASLPEIRQADRLMLLLDGRRVCDAIERANAMQSVRQTLRAFLDNDALGAHSMVQVVTTKYDLIATDPDAGAVKDSVLQFEERLLRDFGPRLRELTFWQIAARDPAGTFMPAYGLDSLLKDWASPRPRLASPTVARLNLRSEFDRLLARTRLEVE